MTISAKARLAFAVGGLSLLATAAHPGAQPDSPPVEVCVAPLADTAVRSTGEHYGGRKTLAIGPWASRGSTGPGTGGAGCSTRVVEQTVNTADGIANNAVYLTGDTNCYSGSAGDSSSVQSDRDSGQQWSFLKFDTSAAAHVSTARLRLFGARSSMSEVCWSSLRPRSTSACDFRAEVSSASGDFSWSDDEPDAHLQSGDVLDSVTLANDKTKRWYEWDVSDWVLRERAAGRHVVTFVLGGNGLASFHSKEAKTNQPELVLAP